MKVNELSQWITSVGTAVTFLSVIAGGIIFLWKREWRTRLQISVDIGAFTKLGDSYLIEPVCTVENKGLLRCYIYMLNVSVRYLLQSDSLVLGDKGILFATQFPNKAVKVQFIKPEWEWSYVEAGIKLRFSHVMHIP